jgi:hypothetical protein
MGNVSLLRAECSEITIRNTIFCWYRYETIGLINITISLLIDLSILLLNAYECTFFELITCFLSASQYKLTAWLEKNISIAIQKYFTLCLLETSARQIVKHLRTISLCSNYARELCAHIPKKLPRVYANIVGHESQATWINVDYCGWDAGSNKTSSRTHSKFNSHQKARHTRGDLKSTAANDLPLRKYTARV